MPRGDDDEIFTREKDLFRFVALPATRALLERPTLNSSLIGHQLALMAENCFELARSDTGASPSLRTYANSVADARVQSQSSPWNTN